MSGPVAAVVVTYNSERQVGDLLDSLPAAFGDVPHEIIVVDNGSSDGTLALLEARDDCLVIAEENRGYAAGVNRGAAAASPDSHILILNPDAVLDPGSVPAMLAVLARPRVGIVAPRVREEDGRLAPTLRREPTIGRIGGLSFTGLPAFAERIEDPREYEAEHSVDWAVGAILLVHRDCYDELGGLDESFFLYSEETDFCLRARDRGWETVYTPDASGMHIGGASGESVATYTMQVLNRVRLYRRRTRTSSAWLYFGVVVANEVRRGILGSARSWPTLGALLRPSRRPVVLNAGDHLLPD